MSARADAMKVAFWSQRSSSLVRRATARGCLIRTKLKRLSDRELIAAEAKAERVVHDDLGGP